MTAAPTIHLRDEGSGPPLVFVHGYFGSSAHWNDQFAEFASDRRVIAPDLAGFGASIHLTAPDSIAEHAALIWAVLDRIGVSCVDLLGHSMGGMIVQEMTAQAPHRVEKLILYGTGPVGVLPGRFETIGQSRARIRRDGVTATLHRIAAMWFAAGKGSPGHSLCLEEGARANIFQAMDQGKGDIDVHPDVWLPNQESFTKKYVDEEGTVILSEKPYEGKQGFCVFKEFSEKHDVKSIFDLTRPEVAAEMDSDGNGKGEIWIGAPGWASANVNEVKVRDYELMAFMEPVRAEQSVMVATVGDTIDKGKGYAFYCYAPHAIWFMFDVVQLEEPEHDPEMYKMVQPSDDLDWLKNSFVASEDALKKVQIDYSKSLEERSPAIAEFLANIQLDTDTVSNFAFEIAGNERDPAEVAKEWVANNSDRVDGWLGL